MLKEIASEDTPLLLSKNKESENEEKKFTSHESYILTICIVGVFFQYMPLSFVISFIPVWAEENLNMTTVQVGVWFSLYFFAAAISSIIAAYCCVYFGRNRTVVLGFLIQMAGLFWFATSKGIYTFYFARLLTGFGLGLTGVGIQSIITARFSHNLTTAIAYREFAAAVQFVGGPALGGILFEYFGFFWTFIIAGIIMGSICPFFFTFENIDASKERQITFKDFWESLNYLTVLTGLGVLLAELNFNFVDPTLQAHFHETLGFSAGQVGAVYGLFAASYAVMSGTYLYIEKYISHFVAFHIGCIGLVICLCLFGPLPFTEFIFSSYSTFLIGQIFAGILYGSASCLMLVPGYQLLEWAVPPSEAHPELVATIYLLCEYGSCISPIYCGVMLSTFPSRPLPICDKEVNPKCESSFSIVMFAWACVLLAYSFLWICSKRLWKDYRENGENATPKKTSP